MMCFKRDDGSFYVIYRFRENGELYVAETCESESTFPMERLARLLEKPAKPNLRNDRTNTGCEGEDMENTDGAQSYITVDHWRACSRQKVHTISCQYENHYHLFGRETQRIFPPIDFFS